MMVNCSRRVQLQVRLPTCRSKLLVLFWSGDERTTSTDEFNSLHFVG